jgi:hypothetical protein
MRGRPFSFYLERFNSLYNDYNYELCTKEYYPQKEKIPIICPNHGIFYQNIEKLSSGHGCPRCTFSNWHYTVDEFIAKAIKIHNDFYDYKKVDFKFLQDKIEIICPIHGEFFQSAKRHLYGNGCRKCSIKIRTSQGHETLKEKHAIKKINLLKNSTDIFEYPKVEEEIKNYISKITVFCKKHDKFFKTRLDYHLLWKNGCAFCKFKSKGEKAVSGFLRKKNIIFETEKKYENLVSGNNNPLRYDFFLPEHNTLIEFDGDHHRKPIKRWGGEEKFKIIQLHDRLKNEFAESNNIKLIRINQIKSIKSSLDFLY